MSIRSHSDQSWVQLYRLLTNDQGIRLRLRLLDTVLLQDGVPSVWLYNDKEGVVRSHPPTRLKLETVVQTFVEQARDDKHVAVVRTQDGAPQVLSRLELEALVATPKQQEDSESFSPAVRLDELCSIQLYVQPLTDLRYIATYNNDGTCTSCHTHQRQFSLRYCLSVSNLVSPEPTPDPQAATDPGLGPVDPSIKMGTRRTVQTLAQHLSRAHGASLRSLVCEFVQDASGTLCLLGVLRADWVSSPTGAGGEPWGSAAFQPAVQEASWVGRPATTDLHRSQNLRAGRPVDWRLKSLVELPQDVRVEVPDNGAIQSHVPARDKLRTQKILPYAMVKGGAVLTSHLTRQLVGVMDALTLKTDQVDKLERDIQGLQHDKHIITQAFDKLSEELRTQNNELLQRVGSLTAESEELKSQLEISRLQGSAAAAARDELKEQLDQERDDTLGALREAQRLQRESQEAADLARKELGHVQKLLREEKISFEALKRQAVIYHNALVSAGMGYLIGSSGLDDEDSQGSSAQRTIVAAAAARPEGRFWRTLDLLDPMLRKQDDPTGERYALTQLLFTWQGDLHAIFLNYCLFEPDYAAHWPPALGHSGWNAFLLESEACGAAGAKGAATNPQFPGALALLAKIAINIKSAGRVVEESEAHPSNGRDNQDDAPVNNGPPETSTSGDAPASTPTPGRDTVEFHLFCVLLIHLADAMCPAKPQDPCSLSLSERARRYLAPLVSKAGKLPVKTLAPLSKPSKAKPGTPGRPGLRRGVGRGRL